MAWRLDGLTILCIALAALEAGGAGLWCVAGAGIYGSPLDNMHGDELRLVLAFLLIGPFLFLAASLLMLARPRLGGGVLAAGGVASG